VIDKLNTIEILKSQYVEKELYSCQIITTILALENLFGINDNGISIYQKWIKSRGKRDIKEATFSLINLFYSIGQKGYDNRFPLEINNETFSMLGGAHRLGICLFLNIKEVPVSKVSSKRKEPKKYDISYFSKILNDSEFRTLNSKLIEVNKVIKHQGKHDI
jgi:hypothetical protein